MSEIKVHQVPRRPKGAKGRYRTQRGLQGLVKGR